MLVNSPAIERFGASSGGSWGAGGHGLGRRDIERLISLSSLGGHPKIGDVLRPGQEFPNGGDAEIDAQQIIHRPGLNQAAAQPV